MRPLLICALATAAFALPAAAARAATFTDAPASPANVGSELDPSLVTADFNGDGKMDLARTDQSSGSVAIMLSNGDGTFRSAGSAIPVAHAAHLAVGDFNGDHKQICSSSLRRVRAGCCLVTATARSSLAVPSATPAPRWR